jgi:hypothetical protein
MMRSLVSNLSKHFVACADKNIPHPGLDVGFLAIIPTFFVFLILACLSTIVLSSAPEPNDWLEALLWVLTGSAFTFLASLVPAAIIVGMGLTSRTARFRILVGGSWVLPPVVAGLTVFYYFIFHCSYSALKVCEIIAIPIGYTCEAILLAAAIVALVGWWRRPASSRA